MKLITEHYDSELEYIVEGSGSEKKYAIEGVFMQANIRNRNQRIYPMEVLSAAVARYVKEQVETGRAVGELNHPTGPTINLDKVSHRITDLHFRGNDVVGKAVILDTPMGKIVKGLLDGGVKLGVSSRGMGTVEKDAAGSRVKEDYILATVDIVQDPSAPSAFVNGIMEGVEWAWDNGILKPQQLELYETKVKNARRAELTRVQEQIFVDFLSSL